MAQSDPTRDGRNAKLWALLPPKDESYDLDQLSEGETAALVEALGGKYSDDIFAQGHLSLPLPSNVEFVMLEDIYHGPSDLDRYNWDENFMPNRSSANGVYTRYPLVYFFPFHFDQRSLRIYFQNQFDRFCLRQTREMEQFWQEQVRKDPRLPPFDHSQVRLLCEEQARKMIYKKPCYEFYALYFLGWIEGQDPLRYPEFSPLVKVDIAAQLGRLVEQYYWRFRFEDAAVTGIGARKGASAGGQAKAQLHRINYSTWQEEALSIWSRRPQLSKTAVAEQISRGLGGRPSARHVARYIKHP